MADFWSSDHITGNIKDPKRKFRFAIYMTGLGATGAADTTQVWFAKTATKPSFQVNAAEHKYLNHTFYYPGAITWQDVSITLVDPQSPDVAGAMGELMKNTKYAVPASAADLSTMTKSSASRALGMITIEQLDGDGKPVEQWTLNNAFITEMKFGDLAYGDDELTELSLSLKYDWATLEDASSAKWFEKTTSKKKETKAGSA